jgi:hypothetical protein
MNTKAKDLTQEAPRSPRERVGGYVILARMVDKGRALLHTSTGEYHFACPLDQSLFTFRGVESGTVKDLLATGASDEDVVEWLSHNGIPKTPAEIRAWSDTMDKSTMHGDPEKGSWFDAECQKLGLDPARTTVFEWLEADDRASFGVPA